MRDWWLWIYHSERSMHMADGAAESESSNIAFRCRCAQVYTIDIYIYGIYLVNPPATDEVTTDSIIDHPRLHKKLHCH
jgi:hypothetical protein